MYLLFYASAKIYIAIYMSCKILYSNITNKNAQKRYLTISHRLQAYIHRVEGRLAPSLSRMGFDRVYPVYYEISFELETENERDL